MECLQDKTGPGFAAVAFLSIMRAKVESVDVCSRSDQVGLEFFMNFPHVRGLIFAERDTALVGHYDDFSSLSIEISDGLFDSGQQVKVFPSLDVFSFGRFLIDDTISVEEDESLAFQNLHKVLSFQLVF